MSVYAVEKVLWELVNDPGLVAEFKDPRSKYLAPYRLTEDEKKLLGNAVNFPALKALGVNERLLLAADMLLNGPEHALAGLNPQSIAK